MHLIEDCNDGYKYRNVYLATWSLVETFILEMSDTSEILSTQGDRLDLKQATFWLFLWRMSCVHSVSGFVLKISFGAPRPGRQM